MPAAAAAIAAAFALRASRRDIFVLNIVCFLGPDVKFLIVGWCAVALIGVFVMVIDKVDAKNA